MGFSLDYIKERMGLLKEEDRKYVLAKLVPSIFVTQGDEVDTFALEANGKWSKDKYPREILPAVRAYKTALIMELRNAEWIIKYLQEDGVYPMDELTVKVGWEAKSDNSV
jgi:hypothetical protein